MRSGRRSDPALGAPPYFLTTLRSYFPGPPALSDKRRGSGVGKWSAPVSFRALQSSSGLPQRLNDPLLDHIRIYLLTCAPRGCTGAALVAEIAGEGEDQGAPGAARGVPRGR